MKRAILTFFTLIFFLSFSQAQVDKPLKGPKAKNYKPWKEQARSSSKILVSENPADLKGPAAKNYKPWEDQKRSQNLVAASTSDKQRVTGPEAKNAKPWENRVDSNFVASDKKKESDSEDKSKELGKE